MMDFTSFERHELIVLVKALRYVKFRSIDYDASELAGSPFIGSMYASATEDLWARARQYNPNGESNSFLWPDIQEDVENMTAIKAHILHVENWLELAEDVKRLYILDLIYPFNYNEQTVLELLEFGNESYNVNSR